MHACMYACMHVCMCIHIHIHKMYMCIYIYTALNMIPGGGSPKPNRLWAQKVAGKNPRPGRHPGTGGGGGETQEAA